MNQGNGKSPIPPGAMVEVDVGAINEGLFVAEVNAKLHKAIRELYEYEKSTGDRTGQIEVTAKIKVGRMANTRDHFQISTKVTCKLPEPESVSEAKDGGDKLLCQPVGTNDDVDQQLFYDMKGRVIGADGRPILVETGRRRLTPPRAEGAEQGAGGPADWTVSREAAGAVGVARKDK